MGSTWVWRGTGLCLPGQTELEVFTLPHFLCAPFLHHLDCGTEKACPIPSMPTQANTDTPWTGFSAEKDVLQSQVTSSRHSGKTGTNCPFGFGYPLTLVAGCGGFRYCIRPGNHRFIREFTHILQVHTESWWGWCPACVFSFGFPSRRFGGLRKWSLFPSDDSKRKLSENTMLSPNQEAWQGGRKVVAGVLQKRGNVFELVAPAS